MNTFIRKVDAERKVLSIINIYTKGKGQLTGLSSAAINNWSLFHKVSGESSIFLSINLLADLCNSLSDRSNENFVKIPTERLIKIDMELIVLRKSVRKLFVKQV